MMKHLFIIIGLIFFQIKNSHAIRCEGGMLEEQVIDSMETLSDQLTRVVANENKPVMTEEQKIKGLIDLRCINAAYGEKGIKEFKDKILFKRDALDDGHIGRFCNELGIDASTLRDGDLNNMNTDSLALSSLRREIIYACFPDKEFTIQNHLYEKNKRISDDKYQKFATIITQKHDRGNNLDDLVRYLFKIYPDIFSCEKTISTTYIEGHVYLNIFLSNLYPLADYLLPELNGKEGSLANNIPVLDVLNNKDKIKLKEILCEKKSWKKYEKDATRYLRSIFKNDKCP